MTGIKYPLTLKPRKEMAEGEFLTGYNTKLMLGDREIYGVASADIKFRPDDVVRAEITLFTVEEGIEGVMGVVKMTHPFTGEFLEIDTIEFANGEIVKFNERKR